MKNLWIGIVNLRRGSDVVNNLALLGGEDKTALGTIVSHSKHISGIMSGADVMPVSFGDLLLAISGADFSDDERRALIQVLVSKGITIR